MDYESRFEPKRFGKARTIKPDSKAKKAPVRFHPRHDPRELEFASLDVILGSLANWFGALDRLACPKCEVRGTLSVERRKYALAVDCGRFEDCGYRAELLAPAGQSRKRVTP